MIYIKANDLIEKLSVYLDLAIERNEIINVNTDKGNIVMLSEEEYNGMMETLYVKADPFYNEVNLKRLRKSITDLNAGKGTEHDPIETEHK